MKMTAITSTKPRVRLKISAAPSQNTSGRPSTAEMTSWVVTARVGVLRTGCTRPNAAGSTPLRPMPYHIRVATFWQARLAPKTDVNIAIRARHHRLPQTRCAIVRAGNSADVGSLARSLVPQPMTWPQMTITSIAPMIAMEAIVARGTLRLGALVSSASGTAASQPVRPCTVNTTASANPDVVAMWPGLKP